LVQAGDRFLKDKSYDKAVELYEIAYKQTEIEFHKTDPRRIKLLQRIAALHKLSGDHVKGKKCLEEAFDLSMKLIGETDPLTISIFSELRKYE